MRQTGRKNTVTRPPPGDEGSNPGAHGRSALPPERPSAGPCPPRRRGVASTAAPRPRRPRLVLPAGRRGAGRAGGRRALSDRRPPARDGEGAPRGEQRAATFRRLRTPGSGQGGGARRGALWEGGDGSARADPPQARGGGGGGRAGRAVCT